MNTRHSVLLVLIFAGICSIFVAEKFLIEDREPIGLSYDKETGQVEFKVKLNRCADADRELSRMKKEIEKLFKGKKLKLEGYTFKLDGYPTWAPYSSFGPCESEIHLIFAEKITVDRDKKVVNMVGSKEKPSSYYPYDLLGY